MFYTNWVTKRFLLFNAWRWSRRWLRTSNKTTPKEMELNLLLEKLPIIDTKRGCDEWKIFSLSLIQTFEVKGFNSGNRKHAALSQTEWWQRSKNPRLESNYNFDWFKSSKDFSIQWCSWLDLNIDYDAKQTRYSFTIQRHLRLFHTSWLKEFWDNVRYSIPVYLFNFPRKKNPIYISGAERSNCFIHDLATSPL